MKVWKNGTKIEADYETTCHDLGFIPDARFVVITSAGTIDYSAGKMTEIMALKNACRLHGYKMSKNLEGIIC